MDRIFASFRDRSGYVYQDDAGNIVRTINPVFKEDWQAGMESGLLPALVEKGLLVPFSEHPSCLDAWKCILVEKIPFISYPYEWSFSQLKDSALLTLEIMKEALEEGMVLKDASAYNVQFIGAKPIFIDILSLESRKDESPWTAYKQFCTHFLAPLALSSHVSPECGCMSRLWIDGIPLHLASKFLPAKTYFSWGLLLHLHLHSRMQKKYSDTREHSKRARDVKVTVKTLNGIVSSLENTIKSFKSPDVPTEWGGYYNDTNYSDTATESKIRLVDQYALSISSLGNTKLAIDIGANTGRYSRLLASYYDYVLAPDIDPAAVEQHYLHLKKEGNANILPLVIDLTNASPSLGWACSERDSFDSRCSADILTALALIHHLVITAGISFDLVARYFYGLLGKDGHLLIEFVPKEDSQVQRMLASRLDVFSDYNLEEFLKAFSKYFKVEESVQIPETDRTLHIMRKIDSL